MRKLGKIKINIKEPTPTAAERLQKSQQAIRKAKGLPDPSEYKKMAAQKQSEIDAMKEEKQPQLSKLRNFVAKNAKTAGAGKHKDVKKAVQDVRGQKHKGKMEEEIEQIDELSKSTLSSYKSKADDNYAHHNKEFFKAIKVRDTHLQKANITSIRDRKPWPKEAGQAADKARYHSDQGDKRDKGLDAAEKRLNREEVELLDEMPESAMKTRDVHAHLKSKGWSVARTSGGHDIYKHPKAKNIIAVPRHKQLKAPLIKGILKSSQVSEEVMDEQLVKQGRFYSGPVKRPFKSNTIVTPIKEGVKIGGIGGGPRRKSYGPPTDHSVERDTLENIPYNAKTEKEKRIKAALSDFGDKMKAKYPNLAKEDLNAPITIVKKGTNIKQKISPNSYATFKQHGFRKEETVQEDFEFMGEDENDYRRRIEKNNKRFVAAAKRQKNPLSNIPIAQEIEKRMKQKSVKESAAEPTEGEMRGKQGISRRAQIVKDAAKGSKSGSPDKFQKDPELSSEIHKT